MLIVVENGNIGACLQLLFDFKAAGGGDIFEIDSAEGSRKQGYGLYDLIDILSADTERDGIDAAESLEEGTLAFHDRHAGFRADVAQAQDGSAVSDDRHGVPPAGQVIAFIDIFLYFEAGGCHAGGVGDAERFIAVYLGAKADLYLSFPFRMLFK